MTPRRIEDEPWWRGERAALLRRRRAAGLRRPPDEMVRAHGERPNDPIRELPTVGLALSGGGIRAATFCLGLLRGLAQRSLLPRLDYLSTVSGGGYIGAMFGRLVLALGVRDAQALLASRRSPVLDWLRRNGRYLAPSGVRDAGLGLVTYLRAFVAMHAELSLAALLASLLVCAPHLWQVSTRTLDAQAWAPWHTLWWPLAAAWLAFSVPGLMFGYWLAREGPLPKAHARRYARRDLAITLVLAASSGALTWLAWRLGLLPPLRQGLNWTPFALLAGWSLVLGLSTTLLWISWSSERRGLAVARLRNRFTAGLALALRLGAALLAVGALDLLSWWMLEVALADNDWLLGGLGLGGLAVLLMRALAQPLQQMLAQGGGGSAAKAWGPRLLNAAGTLAVLGLFCFWLVVVQWLLFTSQPFDALLEVPPLWRAIGLALLCLLWWFATSANEGMANASSLHSFYRARLVRAYLSVGNPRRPVLDPDASNAAADVTQVVPEDDIELDAYHPERHGGPLHLINTCLNQTRDDSSGLFNADRKGTLLTVLPASMEIDVRGRIDFGRAPDAPPAAGRDNKALEETGRNEEEVPELGTLGRWIAISGAAASPGAGSYTSRGWALLLFLLGVRLGHWVRAPRVPAEAGAPPAPAASARERRIAAFWALGVKPMMLWAEATASFFGRARPWWYLSDGGHFENTGVYALLKRELDFIILADCGADGRYEFNDLENLVRKARIDLGAEIEFYPRHEAELRFKLRGSPLKVLSPEDMADNHSVRGVMLARVRYLRATPNALEHHGTLLVVKPTLHGALDVDLLAYAMRHPAFPHESTGDQFFDEAQWESYHRLGEDAGSALHESGLARLPGWQRRVQFDLSAPAALRQSVRPSAAADEEDKEPVWRRAAKSTALGTTIGVGASGTLLLSLWQVSDQLRQNETTQRNEVRSVFTKVSEALSAVNFACPKVPDHVTLQVALLRDLSASPSLLPTERVSVQRLLERTREKCENTVAEPNEACSEAVRQQAGGGICSVVGKPLASVDALSYWHPIERETMSAQVAWQRLVALWQRDKVAAAGAATEPAPQPAEREPPEQAARPPSATPGAAADAVAGGGPAASGAAAAANPEPKPEAAPSPAAALAALACTAEANEPLRIYVQVYDEPSRRLAALLRQRLQAEVGVNVQVAPIENVSRSSELRQQRKPVPWPQPTFIVHRRSDEPCAQALRATVSASWRVSGGEREVWVGELPKSLQGRSSERMIELWLPPQGTTAGGI